MYRFNPRFQYSNGTLKNRLGIHDPNELSQLEYFISAKRMRFLLGQNYRIQDVNQLKPIHKYLFGSLYSWAGKQRDYDLTKNGHDFLPHSVINNGVTYVNGMLNSMNRQSKLKPLQYAKLLDNINDMHPFREGNGRSTKTFLQLLAKQHHQFLNYPRDQSGIIRGLSSANDHQIAKYVTVSPYSSLKLKTSVNNAYYEHRMSHSAESYSPEHLESQIDELSAINPNVFDSQAPAGNKADSNSVPQFPSDDDSPEL